MEWVVPWCSAVVYRVGVRLARGRREGSGGIMQGVDCTASAAVGFCSRNLAHHDRLFLAFVQRETVLSVSSFLVFCPHVEPDRVDHGPDSAEDL